MKTDYCLRVLIYLQTVNKKSKIKDIAAQLKISKNHLSVAVNLLSEHGYVISTSGPAGGVEFNPHFKNKKVGELVSKIEKFNIVECFDPATNSCTLGRNCELHKMLKKATSSFLKELNKYKIVDLVNLSKAIKL